MNESKTKANHQAFQLLASVFVVIAAILLFLFFSETGGSWVANADGTSGTGGTGPTPTPGSGTGGTGGGGGGSSPPPTPTPGGGTGGTGGPPPGLTLLVNSTVDAQDLLPGDGICDAGAGECTLRAAVMETNAFAGSDTINLPEGSYILTLVGAVEDAAVTGDLDVTDDLSIIGAGAAATIIDGNALDRVMQVLNGTAVSINGITIQNGSVPGSNSFGGGLAISPEVSTVEISDVEISNNTASGGGGLFVGGGTISLNNSTVSGNLASDSQGGGAILKGEGGVLVITNSTISNNQAVAGNGGGIWVNGFRLSASLSIVDSTITGNRAGLSGGGVFINNGTVDVEQSEISANEASSGDGGGINNSFQGDLVVNGGSINENIAAVTGGGVFNSADAGIFAGATVDNNSAGTNGGGIFSVGDMSIWDVTVRSNTAGQDGGGLWINGLFAITNSTISGNEAGVGGGIKNDGSLRVVNTTIAKNMSIDAAGNLFNAGTTQLLNTIVALNGVGADCRGTVLSLGHNLDSDGSCGLTMPGDISGVDPLLGPLQNNGGPTETHALLPGSPAINAADTAASPGTDQRGVARPQGLIADIGAFEAEHVSTFLVNSTADTVDLIPGDGICDAGAGECTLRAAIQEANAMPGPDTINVPAGNYVLTMRGGDEASRAGDLDITDDLAIVGAGVLTTFIDGGSIDRVLDVLPDTAVQVSNINIRNGAPRVFDWGGGIRNYGYLTMTNVMVEANRSLSGGGIFNGGDLELFGSTVSSNSTNSGGAGIRNVGNLNLVESTVSHNIGFGGGGIQNSGILTISRSTINGNQSSVGGGIQNSGWLTVVNSTISGNLVVPGPSLGPFAGGGISNIGSLSLVNTTITGNTAEQGGGIKNAGLNCGPVVCPTGVANLIGSIVAGNTAAGSADCDEFISGGHNLIGSSSGCSFTTSSGDLVDVDPEIGSLRDNGGLTETHALFPSSPAIDAADTTASPGTDQRGVSRPQGLSADIGAYELESSTEVPPLLFSTSPARTSPLPLQDATLTGLVYVYLDVDPAGIHYVDFLIDGAFNRRENFAPYDLAGGSVATANGFSVGVLPAGPHTVVANAHFTGGGNTAYEATFEVETGSLQVSASPDRSAPLPLEGAVLEGSVYIFLDIDPAGVANVEFFVDGEFQRRENVAPYDLAGGGVGTANGFVIGTLSAGPHVVSTSARYDGGEVVVQEATFEVELPTLMVSLTPDRSSPSPLNDAWLTGDVFIFLDADSAGISSVDFLLDDHGFMWTERFAPYDFNGGSVATANGFDTASVFPGTRMATAIVHHQSGGTTVVEAWFIVPAPVRTIEIVKSPAAQEILAGETAEYSITVTNTGETDLLNVGVADSTAPYCETDLGTLAVGESVTYDCAVEGVTEDLLNTVSVNGVTPANEAVFDDDVAYVLIVSAFENRLIEFSKREIADISEQELDDLIDDLIAEIGPDICVQRDGVIIVQVGTAECLEYPSEPGNIAIAVGPDSSATAGFGTGNMAIALGTGSSAFSAWGNNNIGTAFGSHAFASPGGGDFNTARAFGDDSTAVTDFANYSIAVAIGAGSQAVALQGPLGQGLTATAIGDCDAFASAGSLRSTCLN